MKKLYRKPAIRSEEILEQTSLACDAASNFQIYAAEPECFGLKGNVLDVEIGGCTPDINFISSEYCGIYPTVIS